MRTKHLVVIGASAGGLEALRSLLSALPPDFPAAICLVLHMAPDGPRLLPNLLERAGRLPVVHGRSGLRITPGHVYVAPPDFHLLVEPGVLRLTRGPRENRFRPAIDPLFRTAAQVYGPAAIGVVLTGGLDDGTAGLWVIKQLGGTAIVQDPADAPFPSMPESAIQHVQVDHVAPISEIPSLLVRLTSAAVPDVDRFDVGKPVEIEVRIAKEQNALDAGVETLGSPSSFACPECHGVLLQLKEGDRIRFRCHTGHAYSTESLLAEVTEAVERSMWTAIRALEEGGLLLRQLGTHLETGHGQPGGKALMARAEQARTQAEAIRRMVGERGSSDDN